MNAKPQSSLHRFFWGMPLDGRRQFAKRAGTKVGYLRTHLIPPSGGKPNRTPRIELMEKLAKASLGILRTEDVLAHFFQSYKAPPVRRSRGRR